jgi:D-3-phosphoglycerate dehydrogenase
MLMLAVLRHTREIHDAVKEGSFSIRFTLRGGDLWERTVGIIGIGNIGTHVARICGAGFKMRVLAYDPYLDAAEIAKRGATKVDTLEELLAASDVVTIHSPLTKETRHIIDARAFAAMKPTAVLVNTSRGPTVDPAALYDALSNHRIFGAGIDVFDPEPPAVGDPLLSLPNIVLGAHSAGLTEESTRQMALRTVEVALQMIDGERPETLLNPVVWEKRRRAEPELSRT